MKITKAQKEAIVHEIARRIRNNRDKMENDYKKAYKLTKKEKETLELIKKFYEEKKIYDEIQSNALKNIREIFGSNTYSVDAEASYLDRVYRLHMNKELPPYPYPDYQEIRDSLELATLDPSFDVEEFMKKYL